MDERRILIISRHVKERMTEVLTRKQELDQKSKPPLAGAIQSCTEKSEKLQAALINDPNEQLCQKIMDRNDN